ncbi:MAG TPA: V-type ATP synthase subunit E family protein [Gemmatimonadales bacterium]|nr:V-type ATP synthase subunit E family protein [Gemmatimonadales bacterium]
MALEELLRTLEDEARARVEEILGRARAEAAELRASADAALTARREAELHLREIELRAAAARELEARRRAATRRALEARAAALERVRQGAESRLAARAADPSLLPRLRADLAEALAYLGEGPAVVEAAAALHEGLRPSLNGRGQVTFAPATGGGVVLRMTDGSLVVDGSFKSRLGRAWPALAIEVARRMEEGS